MNKTLYPQYIIDEHGSRTSVVLPIQDWLQVLDELKELSDIRLYGKITTQQETVKQLVEFQPTNYDVSNAIVGSQVINELKEWYDCPEILLFTSFGNVYKTYNQGYKSERQLKASIEFDRGEKCIAIIGISNDDESDHRLIFGFKDGYVAKIYTNSFLTNRRKLSRVFRGEECVFITQISDNKDFVLVSSTRKVIVFDSGSLRSISGRKSHGARIMNLKINTYVESIKELSEVSLDDPNYYRRSSYPAYGHELRYGDYLYIDSEE
ncbi:hypothetical protein [Spirosoma luteum]|uniref:hypothetical protein n=1 Tax=Spirosoma luteum TaxID=431553 RepID=UPI00037ABCA6|nr:hypothetical protein [Spirosoma luteum]